MLICTRFYATIMATSNTTAANMIGMINLNEDENAFYVEALAPGLNAETLNVSILQNQLQITGEKTPLSNEIKAEQIHRNERATGCFVRTLDLPSEVNNENIKAEYKNGILRITLQKAESAKPKTVSVKFAD